MAPSYAATPRSINVLASDSDSITVQFDCPDCTDLQPSEVTLEGRSYQKIEIADTGMTHEVGKPQVPVRGVLFAVPDHTEIKVELLDADVESHTGFRLAPTLPPAPSIEERGVAVVDDKTYQTDAFWPGSPVTIGLEGYIRDQRVAQLQFFPVQYNPVQDRITVYKRMLVRVNFLRSPKSVQSW